MQLTPNYKLKKPEETDPIDILDLNDNTDIIDAELKKRPAASGGDLSEMTVKTLEEVKTEFPVPVAGESTKTFLGKVKKFFEDTKNWMTGVCMLGQLVNNCVTNRSDLPLAAAQGKVLMDLYTQLYSDFTILTNYVYKYHPQLLYLYNLGDECTDITGGWIVSQSGYATCVKHDDHITQTVNGGLSLATIETANDINFDNYRHLIVELVSTASGTYGCNLIVSLSAFSFSSPETKDTYENIDVDLTTGGAPGKVIISTRGGGVSISGNRYRNTVISRIWLIPK